MTTQSTDVHVGTRGDLQEKGWTRHSIDRTIASGALTELGRGWLGTPETPPRLARALRMDARLTCCDALELHGVWVVRQRALHVATLRGGRPPGTGIDVVTHKYLHRWPDDAPILPIRPALDHVARCQGPEYAAIALESVAHQRLLDEQSIDEVLCGLPRKLRQSIGHVEPRAESGTETRVRRFLEKIGVHVHSQWEVPGVGRTDMRVGERLIIECDSRAHHIDPDAYARDRRRDQVLVARGYVVLRLTWEDVIQRWSATQCLLKSLVADEIHRVRRPLRARMA